MQLGYFTMPLHPPGSNMTETLEHDMEQIVLLDKLGYQEAWIGEHFTAEWENIPAPDLFIAQALARTSNIVLATGVTGLTNHSPFIVAHRIAQLDHMARGRFYWGVGAGGFGGDYEAMGIDPKSGEQRAIFREALDAVLELWNDPQPRLHEHKQWRFSVPRPVDEIGQRVFIQPFQKPHPPIGVAGVSPRSDTLALAGERGYFPISIHNAPVGTLKTHWEAVEAGAKMAGRTPDQSSWRISRDVYVAETTREARHEALKGTLGRDYEQYWFKLMRHSGNIDRLKVDPNMPDSDITLEYVLDNIMVVGSPDEVAGKLRSIYEETGGFGVLLAMGHEWQPWDKWVRSMTLLKQEVMPMMADLA